MAKIKRLVHDSSTGETVYCIVRRLSDKYRLNDADGSFATSPADPYLTLTEDSVIKGKYEVEESRSAWIDDDYDITAYRQVGGSESPVADTIIGSGFFSTFNDKILGAGGLDAAVRLTYQGLFDLIESQRGQHTAGNLYYWDPINGNDSWEGTSRDTAKLTFAGAYANVVDSNHDIVMFIPSATGGVTQVDVTGDNQIIMNKRYSFLRGPGRDALLVPTTSSHPTLSITAEGCEVSGFRMQTHTAGLEDALYVTGDFASIHNIWIDFSRGHAINFTDVSECLLYNFVIEDAASEGSAHAILLSGQGSSDVRRNFIHSGKILNCTGDAIRIKGGKAVDNFIYAGQGGMFIHGCTGWGVNEFGGADHNFIIGPNFHLSGNTLGNINISGAGSKVENVGFIGNELSNVVEDDIVRDSNGDKLSSTLYMYDSDTNATIHDGATGLLFKYDVTAAYTDRFMTSFKSIKA